MTNSKVLNNKTILVDMLNTEDRILEAAKNSFLLYGFHGTKLQQIAEMAGIPKSSIHYYYRSKEKLYSKVVKHVIENILNTDTNVIANSEIASRQKWFLFTELYNNQICFEKTIKELYLNDGDKKLNEVRELLKIF
jgi:AcrR family transcriptional regulator